MTAFPFTSGYFSKDEILLGALELEGVGFWFWLGGVVGAFFTGIYTFRLFFIVFFSDSHAEHPPGKEVGGGNEWSPDTPDDSRACWGFYPRSAWTMCSAMGKRHGEHHVSGLTWHHDCGASLGIAVSYLFFMSKTFSVDKLMASALAKLHAFWFGGWGFDTLYNAVLVRPFLFLARVNRKDIVDSFYAGCHRLASGQRAYQSSRKPVPYVGMP